MHSQETRLQFIELRAQERTLEEISTTLNVCKRTLVDWNREFAEDIADLREVARESLRRKLFGTAHDWMKGELEHYKRLDTELARREFKYSPTESVFRMRAESRKTIEKFLFAESPLDRPRSNHGRVVTPLTTASQTTGRDAAPVLHSPAQGGTEDGPSASASSPGQPEPQPPQPTNVPQPEIPNEKLETQSSHDQSIVIDPSESAGSIVEKCGLNVSSPKN